MFSDTVLASLLCPVCAQHLTRLASALRCPAGHSFDIARQGYVNLMTQRPRTGTGDTAEMVAAREAFLAAGHYRPIADAVASQVVSGVGSGRVGSGRVGSGRVGSGRVGSGEDEPVLLEVGAGTGYYLTAVVDQLRSAVGIATDVSTAALKRAGRAHGRINAVGADVWGRLPLGDGTVSAVVDVFAPRNGAEFARVLTSQGVLVVVTPEPDHLREVIGRIGMISVDEQKDQRVERTLSSDFRLEDRARVTFEMSLTRDDVARLVGMGPSAHHLDVSGSGADELRFDDDVIQVTAAVAVSRYRLVAT